MLTVADIWEDAGRIFGNCNEEERYVRISDAIELLATKGEWDPLRGYVDICCTGNCVTLPNEVETPLAVLIDGHPSLAQDQLFQFHLNGPGADWRACDFTWIDGGLWPTYADIPGPRRLFAFSTSPLDVGATINIFGQNADGDDLNDTNPVQNSLPIPIQFGASSVHPIAVSRIFRIEKPQTVGRVRIVSVDYSNANCNDSGTLIADMQYWETVPQYRRIRLSRAARWARVYFRRKTGRVSKLTDLIPLNHRFALVTMCRAVQNYWQERIELGLANEAQAVRWMSEKESTLQPPGEFPIQVDIRAGLYDKHTDGDIGWD